MPNLPLFSKVKIYMQSHSTPSLYHKAISFMVSAYFSITLMNVFVKTASQKQSLQVKPYFHAF